MILQVVYSCWVSDKKVHQPFQFVLPHLLATTEQKGGDYGTF